MNMLHACQLYLPNSCKEEQWSKGWSRSAGSMAVVLPTPGSWVSANPNTGLWAKAQPRSWLTTRWVSLCVKCDAGWRLLAMHKIYWDPEKRKCTKKTPHVHLQNDINISDLWKMYKCDLGTACAFTLNKMRRQKRELECLWAYSCIQMTVINLFAWLLCFVAPLWGVLQGTKPCSLGKWEKKSKRKRICWYNFAIHVEHIWSSNQNGRGRSVVSTVGLKELN